MENISPALVFLESSNPMQLECDGLAITLLRKRVKNLNLRIHQTGDVQISAPLAMPLDKVYRFLHDKRAWIDFHRERLLQREPLSLTKTLQPGETLFFLGQPHGIEIHHTLKKNHLIAGQNMLHFFIKPDLSLEKKQQLLKHWYSEQMQCRLPALFEKWESIIGVHAHQYTIKTMKTRWGSCHPLQKRISLNLRLIEKPLICLEYVIVHELVHLLEASHNKRFYMLMSRFMPEWQSIKMQLEAY